MYREVFWAEEDHGDVARVPLNTVAGEVLVTEVGEMRGGSVNV